MKQQLKRYVDKNINKIGFLDIETQGDGFKAQTGNLVSWVLEIYDIKKNKSDTFYNVINKDMIKRCHKEESLDYDREIIEGLIDKMKECDMIVTHYGTWFDIPFIRTRCQILKIPFIEHKDKVRFGDTWRIARVMGSFKRNSLDNVSRTLGIRTHKTKVEYDYWKLSHFGKKKYFDYILKHNFIDVVVTRLLWLKIEQSAPIPARYY